jgi:hypothetical protein
MYSLNLYESTAAFFWFMIAVCPLPLSILCHLFHMAQAGALPMHLDFQYDWRTSTWKLCAIQIMKCDSMGVHDDVQICREHRSNSFCDFSKAQRWD